MQSLPGQSQRIGGFARDDGWPQYLAAASL